MEEIEGAITNQVCSKYNEDDIVFPPALKEGLFMTAAIVYNDHNPSSTGAKSSFQGTSVSIFQRLESNELSKSLLKIDENSLQNSNKAASPYHFTNIMSVKGGKPE